MISTIIGDLEADRGNARLNGELTTSIDAYKNLGVCSQKDVLFETLTGKFFLLVFFSSKKQFLFDIFLS